jgi:hypothetical protein
MAFREQIISRKDKKGDDLTRATGFKNTSNIVTEQAEQVGIPSIGKYN